ncbi:hypothetical protein F53441_11993 [Fusarium austroafricanum]|uniref:C2H2-type domain-containing protein n=1 Tax=Fusarium austroafricanum TaxID=2364996 RepID=A0A8H4K1Q8_9HYPO|nr:hypothetical protein F53441_11993 [Fusarium austroafricanum]
MKRHYKEHLSAAHAAVTSDIQKDSSIEAELSSSGSTSWTPVPEGRERQAKDPNIPERTIAFTRVMRGEDENNEPIGKLNPNLCCQELDRSTNPNPAPSQPTKSKGSRKKNRKARKKDDKPTGALFRCSYNLDGARIGCGEAFTKCIDLAKHYRSNNGKRCIQRLYDQEDDGTEIQDTPSWPKEFPKLLLRQYPELVHYNLDLFLEVDGTGPDQAQTLTTKASTPSLPVDTERFPEVESMSDDLQVAFSNLTLGQHPYHFSHHQDGDFSTGNGSIVPQSFYDRTILYEPRPDLLRKNSKDKLREMSPHIESALTKDSPHSTAISFTSLSDSGQDFTEVGGTNLKDAEAKVPLPHDNNLMGNKDTIEPSVAPPSTETSIMSIDDLTTSFSLLSNQPSGVVTTPSGEDQSNGVASQESSSQSTGNFPSHRKRNHDESSNSDNHDEDQGGNKKKRPISSGLSPDDERLFACPFYKRNPQKHPKARICSGPGWDSIYRVKEHIFRVHRLPIHCVRCRKSFENDAQLTAHQRLAEMCALSTADLPEGFTKEQEKELRRRKSKRQSDTDHWRAMFMILFPDDDERSIPTPYNDRSPEDWKHVISKQIKAYDHYLYKELPPAVTTKLKEKASLLSISLTKEVQSLFADVIRDVQLELSHTYKERDQLLDCNNMRHGPLIEPEVETSSLHLMFNQATIDQDSSFLDDQIEAETNEGLLISSLNDGQQHFLLEPGLGADGTGYADAGAYDNGFDDSNMYLWLD